jgi:uncharacterized protein (UPF0332 family)/predicted nucleotidyltransferase
MEFDQPKREKVNKFKYSQKELDIARDFSKKVMTEFSTFIKGIILFGSLAKQKHHSKKSDVDILIIVDDVTTALTPEFVSAYRIIMQKIITSTSHKLHVISLKLTTFWEYVRAGDPVAVNILREGLPILDAGFFAPVQMLLRQGRIRPSKESIWTYFGRAPRTLANSRWHLTQATLDLYWAVIDAAHAALMSIEEIPPSPDHVADMLEEKLVKKKLLEEKYAQTMRRFYKLMKQITHREIKEISGKEFEHYFEEADEFVERMRKFISG